MVQTTRNGILATVLDHSTTHTHTHTDTIPCNHTRHSHLFATINKQLQNRRKSRNHPNQHHTIVLCICVHNNFRVVFSIRISLAKFLLFGHFVTYASADAALCTLSIAGIRSQCGSPPLCKSVFARRKLCTQEILQHCQLNWQTKHEKFCIAFFSVSPHSPIFCHCNYARLNGCVCVGG